MDHLSSDHPSPEQLAPDQASEYQASWGAFGRLPPPPQGGDRQTPFVAEVRQQDVLPNGSFRPSARLILTPALHTGGLWHALPGEEIKTLLLLLTFLTPNGWCHPSFLELAEAMRVPHIKARVRLSRLAAFRWQGGPIIHEQRRESGIDAFIPSSGLLHVTEAKEPAPAAAPGHLTRAAGREAVVAYSRARYAHPRAEVEREIAQRMGWEDPQERQRAQEEEEARLTDEQRAILARLTPAYVSREQATETLASFEPARIARQLDWLPLRRAKTPARFLLAAIAGDYEPPAGVRTRGASKAPTSALDAPGQAPDGLQPRIPPPSAPLPTEGPADLPPHELGLPEANVAPQKQDRVQEARDHGPLD